MIGADKFAVLARIADASPEDVEGWFVLEPDMAIAPSCFAVDLRSQHGHAYDAQSVSRGTADSAGFCSVFDTPLRIPEVVQKRQGSLALDCWTRAPRRQNI